MLEIKSDAIFIADSHTQNGRDSLILALQKMENSVPSQIFLLGDISNILVGNLKSSVKSNEMLLNTIDSLSQKAQIIYFEGNHDFNLEGILPNVIKIPRKNQPIIANYGDKIVLIAHGDIFLNKKYEIYIKILSAKITAKILNALDTVTFGKLYMLIEKKVQSKKIHLLHDNMAIYTLIKRRIECYQNYVLHHNLRVDLVIEGHFHLGKIVLPNSHLKDLSDSTLKDSQDSQQSTIKSNFCYVALPSFFYEGKALKISECNFNG